MDVRQYLKTACPACKGTFEYPTDYYGEDQACPLCGELVRLVPRPMLIRREFSLLVNNAENGPFSFNQVAEQYRTGALTLDSMYRVLPSEKWNSVRELQLDASDAFNLNEIPVYVKFPTLSYPVGPYSFLEVIKKLETTEVTPECFFWWPTLLFWIDFDVLKMTFESETNQTVADNLERSLRDLTQTEPPPFEIRKSSTGVSVDTFTTTLGSYLGLCVGVILILILIKGCT